MANEPTPKRGQRGLQGKPGARGRTGKQAVTPDAYLEKADELQRSLDGVREELATQNDVIVKVDKTATQSKRTSWTAIAAAVIALVAVAGLALVVDKIIQVRTEGRATSCVDSRGFQTNHNDLARKSGNLPRTVYGDLEKAFPNRGQTSDYGEQQALPFDDTIVPVRKCDGPSIDLFYKSGGVLGCEKSDANPDGRCKK